MNKLLIITVLVALLSINAESVRVARQAEGEEEVHAEVAVEEAPVSEVAVEEEIHAEEAVEAAPVSEVAVEEEIHAEVAVEEAHVEEAAVEESHVSEVAVEEEVHAEVAVEEAHVSEAAVEEEVHAEVAVEEGTLAKFSTSVKTYYSNSMDTANGYLDSIRGLKLEEKAKNLYEDTTKTMKTYAGLLQDQVYHTLYDEQ